MQPDWLDPLFTAEEMRAADAFAIERAGVPSIDLMERASVGLARVVGELAEPGPIRVVAGKGNNGGDGLACARLLREEGREVDVLAVGDLSETKGDARTNLERLPGDAPEPFAPERLEGSGAIVDAMLGTGFEGSPREPVAGAIAAINEDGAPVVACDVPSGVNASTGEIEGQAVDETFTAGPDTFGEVEELAGGQFPVQLPAPADLARDAEAGAGAATTATIALVLGGAGLLAGLVAIGLTLARRRT